MNGRNAENTEKKYFIDHIHAMTDYMGGWSDQWVEIGWYDKKSDRYFNLDEVKELFKKGETENVGRDENGELYMKQYWADARTAFTIICGIPFEVEEDHSNLLTYAKSVGLVKGKPEPVKMLSGTKYLECNQDGTYTVKYQLDKTKFGKPNAEFIKKIAVGSINKLKGATYTYYHDSIKEIHSYFRCGPVLFNEDTLILSITNISDNDVYKREFIDCIRDLDLEFLMSNSSLVNFSNVLCACQNWCRDKGQYHWIGESSEEDEKRSNLYWYDK